MVLQAVRRLSYHEYLQTSVLSELRKWGVGRRGGRGGWATGGWAGRGLGGGGGGIREVGGILGRRW